MTLSDLTPSSFLRLENSVAKPVDSEITESDCVEYVYNECSQTLVVNGDQKRQVSTFAEGEIVRGTNLNWGKKDNYKGNVCDSKSPNVPPIQASEKGCYKRTNRKRPFQETSICDKVAKVAKKTVVKSDLSSNDVTPSSPEAPTNSVEKAVQSNITKSYSVEYVNNDCCQTLDMEQDGDLKGQVSHFADRDLVVNTNFNWGTKDNSNSSVSDPIDPNVPSRQVTENGHHKRNNRKRPIQETPILGEVAKAAKKAVVKSGVSSHDVTPNMTPEDSLKLDGDQEWQGSPFAERILMSDAAHNWGKKVNSNRKDNKFKRYCKGIYVCKSSKCSHSDKRKRKCRICRSQMVHVPCHASITYQLENGKVKYIKHSGKHTCITCIESRGIDSAGEHEIVECVPFDIDGNVSYAVKPAGKSEPWKALSDGRRWGRYISISNPHGDTIYQRNCMGRTACVSNDCPFYVRHGRYNTSQFEKVLDEVLCRECGVQVVCTPCKAKKTYIVSDTNAGVVLIRHEGTHICTPRKKTDVCSEEIQELSRLFPNIKTAVASNTILKQAVISNSTPEQISEVARSLLDKKKVEQIKLKTRKALYPHGTNIKAVITLQESLFEINHDKFLVYRIDEDKQFVMTTSTEKLKIACELSGMGCELWPSYSPYAHVDFQPSRVPGMSVLGVQCYHPTLKQTVPLFRLYAPNELAEVVEYGLTSFNEAVSEFSFGKCPAFSPNGWMCDEAGAIIKSLEILHGPEIHTKLVTCLAHYKASIIRRKKHIKDPKRRQEFVDLAHDMAEELTDFGYNAAKEKMSVFVKQSKEAHLKNWLDWWDCRKVHWALAFRPRNNAPLNNLSECIHSSEKARDSVNVQLIDAVYDDISSSYMLKEKIKGYAAGDYTGGTGRSLIQLSKASNIAQQARSRAYAKSLNSSTRCNDVQFVVDLTATHREDKVCDPRTGAVSDKVIDNVEIEAPKDKTTTAKSELRPTKRRDIPSKLFSRTKDTAIRGNQNYTISLDMTNNTKNESKFLILKNDFHGSEDYIVTISKQPQCGCMFYAKYDGKQVCKHIIMVLLDLGVPEDDPLLYQTGYTESELQYLLSRTLRPYGHKNTKRKISRRKHQFYLGEYIKGSTRGPRSLCCVCKSVLEDGVIVEIDAKYRFQTHSFDKTFKLHCKNKCLSKAPKYSDISRMPTHINRGKSSNENVNIARKLTTLDIE